MKYFLQACDEYNNISPYLAIKITILHELAHALQDRQGKN